VLYSGFGHTWSSTSRYQASSPAISVPGATTLSGLSSTRSRPATPSANRSPRTSGNCSTRSGSGRRSSASSPTLPPRPGNSSTSASAPAGRPPGRDRSSQTLRSNQTSSASGAGWTRSLRTARSPSPGRAPPLGPASTAPTGSGSPATSPASARPSGETVTGGYVEYVASGICRFVEPQPRDRRAMIRAIRAAKRVVAGEIPKRPLRAPCEGCPHLERCTAGPRRLSDLF
jgi:hypothetical protein